MWIGNPDKSAKFPPKCWTVYKRPFRTNNDLEGQNNRLKKFCRGKKLHLYKFFSIINTEFKVVQLNWALIKEKKVIKFRKKSEKLKDQRILQLTATYVNGPLTTSKFLSRLARVYAPDI